jgi:hypothetical protein
MMAMTPEERNARKAEYQKRRRAEDPEYLARHREANRDGNRRRLAAMTDAERAEFNAKRMATVDKAKHAAACREYRARLKAERTNP